MFNLSLTHDTIYIKIKGKDDIKNLKEMFQLPLNDEAIKEFGIGEKKVIFEIYYDR